MRGQRPCPHRRASKESTTGATAKCRRRARSCCLVALMAASNRRARVQTLGGGARESHNEMEEAIFLNWLRVAMSLAALAAVLALRIEGAPFSLYASAAGVAALLVAWATVRYRREGEGRSDVVAAGATLAVLLVGVASWAAAGP